MKAAIQARGGHMISISILVLIVLGCGSGADGNEEAVARAAAAPERTWDTSSTEVRPEGPESWAPAGDSIPGTPWTRQDWAILESTLREADALGLDTLPTGDAIAEMGLLLLGTPYIPRTLEVPGPERLVVNLRALDCVTFVENVLALTRLHRNEGTEILSDPVAARGAYVSLLASLRYRGGAVNGYASRLHYFSDWLTHAEDQGWLALVTGELGGVPDDESVDFMSTHPEAYPQLADARVLDEIREVEARLNAASPRIVIPEERISQVAGAIRTGDVIAATSTVEGLDVAHTGIAVRTDDGVLRLLHAPLVGSTVVLSDRSLADRIAGIGSQDGIMVARPRPAAFQPGAS